MVKQRIIRVMVSLAVLVAVAGSTGIVVDSFGLAATSQAHACSTGSSTGGGC